MQNQKEFQEFIGKIVAVEFPSEQVPFKLSGARTIEKLYDGSDAKPEAHTSGEMLNFVADATLILEFVKLAAGTFLVLKKVSDVFKPNSDKKEDEQQKLKDLWKKNLEEVGLSADKAEDIVQKFTADLQARLD